jgi:4-amino-4-deoxy-L-arabinose transferase-like glycosyltransferase
MGMRTSSVALLALILAAQLCVHAALSSRLFFQDEGFYLAYAWLVQTGEVPYADFWDHHSPVLYYAAVPFVSAFGDTVESARMLSTLAALATTALAFLAAKKLFGEGAGLAAAAFCALFSSASFAFWFVFEPLLSMFSAAAFLLALEWKDSGSRAQSLACGLFIGLAIATKIQAVLFLPALLAFAALARSEGRVSSALHVLAGAAIAPALLLAFFAANGALWEYAYQGVLSNFVQSDPYYVLRLFPQDAETAIGAAALVPASVYAALAALRGARRGEGSMADACLLCAWLALSFAFAFPRFELFHMLPSMAPAAILLGGLAARPSASMPQRTAVAVSAFLFALILASWLSVPGVQAPMRPCGSAPEVMASLSAPGERILVAPYAGVVYAYSGRLPAARYLNLGPWLLTPQMKADAMLELEASPPAAVLYNRNGTFEGNRSLKDYFPELDAFIEQNYEPVAETECGTAMKKVI